MKKLMIAAAIVCAAAISNGAQFCWGFNSSAIEGPTDAYCLDGYLDFGMATASLYLGDTLIISGEMNEDYTFGNLSTSDLATDTTGKVQTLPRGEIADSFEAQAYKLILATNDGKYQIVVEGDSSYKQLAAGAGEPSYNFESFIDNTDWTASDWKAVPEPTSGLLLLLGVAGLALRRRRA